MPSRFEYERAVRGSELPSLSRLLALTVATWADVSTGIIPDRLMPSLATLESATTWVTQGWIDNAFDTQRRRGTVASTRVLITP